MAGLSDQKIAVVRTLVQTAPDRIVSSLQQALAETPDGSALGGVRRLVENEIFERTLRNEVLLPIAPMCVPNGDPRTLTFPPRILGLLWRALCVHETDVVDYLRQTGEDAPAILVQTQQDALLYSAAQGMTAAEKPEFLAVIEACESAKAGHAALLARCLRIGPVVRRAIGRLPEWIAHAGGDTAAGARLAFKDAVELDDDAGPRFFQMLAAQMAQPWMVLRIISAVMDKPNERYMRDSELAGFCEAVFEDVDKTLGQIARLNPDDGAEAGRDIAKLAELVVQQVVEIETCMDLQRDQGWGLRAVKQRASLANVVEGRFKEGEKAVVEALPMQAGRTHRRRALPRLTTPPEPRHVRRAMTLLSFCDELRTTANYGGFASARSKMVEKLAEHLDHYVEDVLDLVRTQEVEDPQVAAAFLDTAADYKQLLMGDKAGELIRRRSHAAITPEAEHAEAARA